MKQTSFLKATNKPAATFAALLGLALTATYAAHAVPIAVNGIAVLNGTTSASRPELAGTVQEDEIREFTIKSPNGKVIKGTFQDRVVKRTSSGTLDFSFRIKTNADSKGSIVMVSRSNFGAYPSVDADFRIDGLGSAGAKSAAFSGGATQFNFKDSPIKSGGESRFHFVSVGAKSYSETGEVTLRSSDGGVAKIKVFSPS